MKLISFADRVRALVMVLGLILAASLGAGHAYAADKGGPLDPKKLAQGMTEIGPVLTAAKSNCEPVAAYWVGQTDAVAADGKTKIKGTRYEVACKAGPGFIVTKMSDTEAREIFTCNQLTKLHAERPESPLCVLPENQPDYKWLQPVVQTYLSNCTVTGARFVGSSSAPPMFDRYEAQCQGMAGGMVDYAQVGSDAPTNFTSCIIQAESNSPCTLSTHDQIVAAAKPLATKADADCQVTDARFVGVNTEMDGFFYEFGCSNKPGFIVFAHADNSVDRIVACGAAANLGGCKFTDSAVGAADIKGVYSKQLADGGYPCTVSDFEIKGTQESTKRDFVEFKCPEQPWGLVGFVPQQGSTSSLRVYDCFADQLRKDHYCTYVTPADLNKQWDKLIKVAKPGKDCDVKDVRYIGEDTEDDEKAIVAELACVNKRGYIAVISGDRTTIPAATACRIAKAHGDPEQCTIAGNGTYTSDDD